jgi:hypothetical protein
MKTILAVVLSVMLITCASERRPVMTLVNSILIQNATGTLNIK